MNHEMENGEDFRTKDTIEDENIIDVTRTNEEPILPIIIIVIDIIRLVV